MNCVTLQEYTNPMGETKVTPTINEVVCVDIKRDKQDPVKWLGVLTKKNLLLERDPLQILSSGLDFPIISDNRHFSEEVYFYP